MRASPWFLLASIPILAAACGDDTSTGGGGAGAAGTGGEGAGPIPCSTADQCPATASECSARVCEGGFCGTAPVAAGTPAKTQALEDCKHIQCDGAGSSQTVPDDDDFKNDNKPCTTDSCSMGMRLHDPLPVGTSCGETGVCDEDGECVECLNATECGTATECATPVCAQGMCDFDFAANGTPLAVQTAGDCKVEVCDGNGQTALENDDGDVFDDSNPCTLDACSMGMGTHDPQPGTPCGVNGTCNDLGQCVGCLAPGDCPGTDDFCKTRTCVDNVCDFDFTAPNTPLPAADQITGNCVTAVCDGMGLVQPQLTPSDVLVDGNECTLDQCVGGNPMNPDAPPGAMCSMGGSVCDGMGDCVGCNSPADCPDPAGACQVASCVANTCGSQNAMDGTVCAAASCSSGTAQLADTCQSGTCADGGSQPCSPYVCGPSACTTTCASDPGCAGGFTCDVGLQECTAGPTCTAYCEAIEDNCTAGNDQYFSLAACLESCSHIPDGNAADMVGNTVGCRTYHAGVAAGDPVTHCHHAGPTGAGVCGSPCDSFCTIAMGACTGANQAFPSMADCQTACSGFDMGPAYSATSSNGDSYACRMYHLTNAAVDPAGHCSHIAANSPTCQ